MSVGLVNLIIKALGNLIIDLRLKSSIFLIIYTYRYNYKKTCYLYRGRGKLYSFVI